MRPENQRMQAFLKENGIDAVPKYLDKGSCKHSWRLYGVTGEKDANGYPIYQKWWGNKPLIAKLDALGFTNLFGEKLSDIDGNGGVFSVFVRGHYELLKEPEPTPTPEGIPYASKQARQDIRANKAARANARITKRNGHPMYY